MREYVRHYVRQSSRQYVRQYSRQYVRQYSRHHNLGEKVTDSAALLGHRPSDTVADRVGWLDEQLSPP